MELSFDVYPYDGEMIVSAKYDRADINKHYFYINIDATFQSFMCDGKKAVPEINTVALPMFNEYAASKVTLPIFINYVEMKYKLILSGRTGCCPYVREQITPEFTFIRWETFCYPMFFDDWDSFRNTGIQSCDIHLTVPADYEVISSEQVIGTQIVSSTKKRIDYIHKKPSSAVLTVP